MVKSGTVVEIVLFAAVSLIVALFGAGIPVHFRATSPALLVQAGRGSSTLKDVSEYYMDSGKVGLVALLWAADRARPATDGERFRLQQIMDSHPDYWLSGGPAPYFQQFLSLAGIEATKGDRRKLIDLLIEREHRGHLLRFLAESSHATVQSILATREINGLNVFMPVNSGAGHPLDASILMTALAAQGDYFGSDLIREIKRLAERATKGEVRELAKLERFYLAILSLGMRFNWLQMTQLVRHCHTTVAVESVAALLRKRRNPDAAIYGIIELSGDPEGIAHFAEKYDERGDRALRLALRYGRGAVLKLLEQNKPLYEAPLLVQWLDKPLAWIRQAPLLNFAVNHPKLALNLKFLVFLVAGYALALSASSLLQLLNRGVLISRTQPLMILGNFVVALFFTSTLWVVMEPTLLEVGPEPNRELHLVFNLENALESLKAQNLEAAMLDQVTIIIILIFLLLQLIVYIYCLIRIFQIRGETMEPRIKLRVLENEDNLFDLGLYIGLGGTVLSLILLAIDVVQASLISAYSSTLFGIIFVAILKVFHVRPYRLKLILQSEGGE